MLSIFRCCPPVSDSHSPAPCAFSLPAEFNGHLGVLLTRCRQRLIERLDAMLEADRLGIRHFAVVSLIERAEGISQVQIGEAMGYDRTTTMKLIDELQQRGMVERRRQHRDRRANAIALTVQGRQWWESKKPLVMGQEAAFMAALTPGEQLLLKELLGRLVYGPAAKTS